jgi:Uma2 family endonuclease
VTDSPFFRDEPWTAFDYFQLGETTNRVELFDGCLLISPAPSDAHQNLAIRLRNAIADSARSRGLRAHHALRVRLGPERVTHPDLVIDDGDWGAPFTWATEAVMVGEVVEETTSLADRVLKRQLYAEARIPWYLLAEPSPPDFTAVTLRLFRLAGDHYVKESVTEPGQTLKTDDPCPFEINTEDLIER